ncbi:MAG: hypothetical protein HYS20_01450 [Rhodocyclales bacterium]|nr:hypothetical protein [Rhodocyclales bacterium]
MGLAVVVIAVPLYFVCSIASVYLGGRILKMGGSTEPIGASDTKLLAKQVAGACFAFSLCLLFEWLQPEKQGFEYLFMLIAVSLFGPQVLGMSFGVVGLMIKGKMKAALLCTSSGALLFAPVFPFLNLVLLIIRSS